MPHHHHHTSRLATAATLVALATLPGAAVAHAKDISPVRGGGHPVDLRSPDTRDATVSRTATVDLRSPDTRDAAVVRTATVDLRSPDTRDAAGPGQARGVVAPAVAPAAAHAVVADTSPGTDWGDVAKAVGGGAAVILIGGGLALVATGQRRPIGHDRVTPYSH